MNHLGSHGRWAFAEFPEIYEIESEFGAKVAEQFGELLQTVGVGK